MRVCLPQYPVWTYVLISFYLGHIVFGSDKTLSTELNSLHIVKDFLTDMAIFFLVRGLDLGYPSIKLHRVLNRFQLLFLCLKSSP